MPTPVEELLTDAFERLRRALERTRLYGVSHPEARANIDEAWQPLAQAIAAAAPLTVQAGLDGLSWRGRQVAAEDEDREGLGRLLHREGVASLTFHPTFDRSQLAALLDVVRINLSLPEFEEETLESLLWQAQIEGLGFRAVAALMEAEAISGDAVRYLQERGGGRVRAVLGSGRAAGRPDRVILPEDALVRALEQAQDEVPLQRESEDDLWQAEDEDGGWEHLLVAQGDADAAEIARLRAAVAQELPGDQIQRICHLLFRAARAERSELPPAHAIGLVRAAVDEIVRQHDTFALVQLVTEARFARDAQPDPDQRRLVEDILALATQPTLIARLLAAAGPLADPAATQQLVDMLDDAAIQALIEWSFPDGGEDSAEAHQRGRWLVTALGEGTARRARQWLSDPNAPPHLMVPALRLIQGRDEDEDRALRPTLLDHPATRVQELVLAWYGETGVPAAELPALLARLEDRRPRVRRATWPVLARHTPEDLPRWFRARLNPRVLGEADDELRQDLCVGCGRILGPRALPMLEQLLERQVGLFAGKGEGRLLLAAALGIAAVGSPAARKLLEEGARSWVGARSQACRDALARLDAGRLP